MHIDREKQRLTVQKINKSGGEKRMIRGLLVKEQVSDRFSREILRA